MIECPNCQTRYNVEVPEAGHKMRCARCGEVWHAMPVYDPDEAAQQDAYAQAGYSDQAGAGDQAAAGYSEQQSYDPRQDYAGETGQGYGADFQETGAEGGYAGYDEHGYAVAPDQNAGQAFGSGFDEGAQMGGEANPPRDESHAFTQLARQGAAGEGVAGVGAAGIGAAPGYSAAADPSQVAPGDPSHAGTSSKGVSLAWVFLATILIGGTAAAALYRTEIVRALPGADGLFKVVGLGTNVRGLTFKDVRYRWDQGEGTGTLTIEGEIVNVTGSALKVPPVLAELRDSKGFVFYRTNKIVRSEALASGERSSFSLTINSPPRAGDLADVRLHFRMDLL